MKRTATISYFCGAGCIAMGAYLIAGPGLAMLMFGIAMVSAAVIGLVASSSRRGS